MAAPRKLSDGDVQWLRRMAARPNPDGTRRTYASLAKVVCCTPTHVRDIVLSLRRVPKGRK